jgi:hypothetical protein
MYEQLIADFISAMDAVKAPIDVHLCALYDVQSQIKAAIVRCHIRMGMER